MARIKYLIIILIIGSIWSSVMVIGTFQGWFLASVAPKNDAASFIKSVEETISKNTYGSVAIVLIEQGRVAGEIYKSIGSPVNKDTQFQVASLSKWVTATGVMKLVQDGKINLDSPISSYLNRWQLPNGKFDNSAVTARRLLSHTGGLTDGLGFGGYLASQPLPTIEEALKKPNAAFGETEIKVGIKPGSKWLYSGGGYLILQLVIEEVSGMSFEHFMQSEIFEPLNMTRSTFIYPDNPLNIASSYDWRGEIVPFKRYTESGAAGLYTSALDLTRFLQSTMTESPLTNQTLQLMRQPQTSILELNRWGLGVKLLSPTPKGDYIFGHGGNILPAINTWAQINPDTNDGLIVMVSGNQFLAAAVASDWNIWQTGRPNFTVIPFLLRNMIPTLLAGWGTILFLAGIFYYFHTRKKRTNEKM